MKGALLVDSSGLGIGSNACPRGTNKIPHIMRTRHLHLQYPLPLNLGSECIRIYLYTCDNPCWSSLAVVIFGQEPDLCQLYVILIGY